MSVDLGPGSGRLVIPGMSGGATDTPSSEHVASTWAAVPWRTICASVGVVAGTYFVAMVLAAATRVLVWVAIAAFMAVILAPLVRNLEGRVGGRRSLAAGLVVFTTLAVVVGVVALFVIPVRTQLTAIITDLPGTVTRAAHGKGPVGEIVKKLHLERYVRDNEQQIRNAATRLSQTSFQRAQTLVSAGTAFITTTLLTFLFLSQTRVMAATAQGLLPARRRLSATRITRDAAAAVSGYVIANLIISVIAGSLAFICLLALGVPAPVVLALLVAVTDLVPLVGATFGAAVCVLAAYLHSPTAGVIALVFFIVYQQTENLVIYPWLMSRKVKVNPVIVLLSVLLAVELFGLLGALLAIPVSGAVQVVVKAVRRERPLEQLLLPDSVLQNVHDPA
jgi:predicted PurR-regulated permease PerM